MIFLLIILKILIIDINCVSVINFNEKNENLSTEENLEFPFLLEPKFPFNQMIEIFMKDSIVNQIKNQKSKAIETKSNLKFLENKKISDKNDDKHAETNSLKFTDDSIDSLLMMAQRAIPLNFSFKNNTANPLPIAIDSSSLSLIIPELSTKYPENTNMTLTIYENSESCRKPNITMAIDGTYLDFDIGIKMAVFNQDSMEYEEILDVIISSHIKTTIFTEDNKLNLFIMKFVVDDLDLKTNLLDLSKDNLITKFSGFFSLIVEQTRKKVTQVDVLKILNNFSGINFSSFKVIVNVGNIDIQIQ